MEAILFCFFDKVFTELDRGCLLARYKRRELVDYLSTVIQGCTLSNGKNCDPQVVCRATVEAIIDFHNNTLGGNNGICLLGKYHNILYVAAKVCYDWKLEDNETVCRLLKSIFQCERTFERLMVGAIFGTRVTHIISGWKSDFADRIECMRAVEYFLNHASKGKLMFNVQGRLTPMARIPIESYSNALPTKVCVQAGRSDVLQLFIKYGGGIVAADENITSLLSYLQPQHCGLQLLIRHLQDIGECGNPLPKELLECLNIYIQFLPRVPSIIFEPTTEDEPVMVHAAILAAIPYDKTGYNPPTLKHMCRCLIYFHLSINGHMPHGVTQLGLPTLLQNYIYMEESL